MRATDQVVRPVDSSINPYDRKWISRKEISTITGFSVHRIRRNEVFLGLDKIKIQVNARTVLYYRVDALVVLSPFIAASALRAPSA